MKRPGGGGSGCEGDAAGWPGRMEAPTEPTGPEAAGGGCIYINTHTHTHTETSR